MIGNRIESGSESESGMKIEKVVGFGTSRVDAKTLRRALTEAILNCGVRSIDTAKVYGNEHVIGHVLHELLGNDGASAATAAADSKPKFRREEFFITSKLWNDEHRPEYVRAACETSLKNLQLEYLDLYLIHWPVAWRKGTVFCKDSGVTLVDTWLAMEQLVRDGLVKSIGVSNFSIEQLQLVMNDPRATIKPSANQIELHPYLAQNELVSFCQNNGIAVVAWSPLSKGKSGLKNEPVLTEIARVHNKTVTQIVLRWHLQRGVGAIPMSTNVDHIRENMDVVNFTLGDAEMSAISSLDCGWRSFPDLIGVFPNARLPARLFGGFVDYLARFLFFFIPNRIDLKARVGLLE